jgi:hypothetical protein
VTQEIVIAIVSGGVVGAINIFIFSAWVRKLDRLQTRVVELEDVRLANLVVDNEKRDQRQREFRQEIMTSIDKLRSTIELFFSTMQEGLENAKSGRAVLHERINKETIRPDQFNARFDDLLKHLGGMANSIADLTLSTRQSERELSEIKGALKGVKL